MTQTPKNWKTMGSAFLSQTGQSIVLKIDRPDKPQYLILGVQDIQLVLNKTVRDARIVGTNEGVA